ncbi:MAG: Flp pilus assembly protein CpaB [Pseudomonadota bacterium]|jgi:pilus assembly protein CpaB
MNRRFIIMFSIALLLAMLAAWVAKFWIQARAVPDKTMSVVVAAVEIPYGVKLEDAQVKLLAWPGSSIPQGAFSSKEQVLGKVTKNNYYPDEPITEKRMSEHAGGSTLSGLITKDYRAISVRVDDVVGVAGFILPGNKVDVLSTKKESATNKAITKTLLQNIKVLAVDQEVSQEKDKPAIVRAVTLELKPEQAEIIVQAMQEGTIQLTLRNPDDPELVVTQVSAIEVQPVEKIATKKRGLKIIPW